MSSSPSQLLEVETSLPLPPFALDKHALGCTFGSSKELALFSEFNVSLYYYLVRVGKKPKKAKEEKLVGYVGARGKKWVWHQSNCSSSRREKDNGRLFSLPKRRRRRRPRSVTNIGRRKRQQRRKKVFEVSWQFSAAPLSSSSSLDTFTSCFGKKFGPNVKRVSRKEEHPLLLVVVVALLAIFLKNLWIYVPPPFPPPISSNFLQIAWYKVEWKGIGHITSINWANLYLRPSSSSCNLPIWDENARDLAGEEGKRQVILFLMTKLPFRWFHLLRTEKVMNS